MADVFTLNLSNGLQYSYQIVHSKRAKYIRIKLSQQGDLSVTLPAFTKLNLAHEFIHSKRVWIEKNLSKVTAQATNTFPEFLDLKLLEESWKVVYSEKQDMGTQISSVTDLKLKQQFDQTIEIQGNPKQLNDSALVSKRLNQWCRKKAQKIFNVMLQDLAELHGFHYQRLSIRAQKTRWGSCSHQKNINLNCKLLFMPEEVVKYVMIHELCHTIEMNHSSRFWALVEECDPQYRAHKKQLKILGKEIAI
ncbi:MAG: SprT family zinc-dependent metalloprotease [Cocleimonas sp.]